MSKRDLWRLAALLLLGLGMARVEAAINLVWAPPGIDETLVPGETKILEMHLVNDGNEPLRVRFYVADALSTARGGYEFADPDPENPYSCADWLELSHTEITLPARQGHMLGARLQVPRGVSGSRYAGIIAEVVPPEVAEAPDEARVAIRWSMATFLSLTIGGRRHPKSAEVIDLEAVRPPEGQGALRVTARLQNNSEVHVFGQGRLTFRDAGGRRVRETPLGQGRGMILPGAQMAFSSLFPRPLPPGEYTAEVSIHYGGDRGPARASVPFTVTREAVVGRDMIREVAFYVEPEYREGSLAAGSMRALDVRLINLENVPIEVQVEPRDVAFDEAGRVVVLDTVGGENSVAPWVTLNLTGAKLAPREQRTVRATVRVPREFEGGGAYGSLLFTASMTDEEGKLRRSQEGTALLLSVPRHAQRASEIAEVDVAVEPGTGNLMTLVTLENTGNVYLRPAIGTVALHRLIPAAAPTVTEEGVEIVPSGAERFEKLEEMALTNVNLVLLPGAQRGYLAMSTGRMEPGMYRADIVVEYGGESPALASHRFAIEARTENVEPSAAEGMDPSENDAT